MSIMQIIVYPGQMENASTIGHCRPVGRRTLPRSRVAMEHMEDRAATFAGAMRIRAIRASVRVLGMAPGMAVVWCALE